MSRRQTAHLTRLLIEGISSWSPYKGTRLSYSREESSADPITNVDQISRLDIHIAIRDLYKEGELSEDEIKMLFYVMLDGRLSRRDISQMIRESEGIYVNQRTISRRLESAYLKIQRRLGFEYGDGRVLQIAAKKSGKPYPYIFDDLETSEIISKWERV